MSARTHAPSRTAVRTLPLTSAAGVRWRLTPASGASAGTGTGTGGPAADLPEPVPATVPGEVHTDLLAAGAIPDPFDGANESALAWIGRTDWTYRAEFSWQPNGHTRHDLVAQGLDTIATVRLNGTVLGRTRNQHRSYRFDVTGLLVEGQNELVVEFEAPVTAAERLSEEIGRRPHVNHHPYNAIRKMAANYGWDWGPDVATAGIWKPIAIESWTGVRLAAVRPLATVDAAAGVLTAHVDLEWERAEAPAVLGVEVGGVTASVEVPAGRTTATVQARVEDARLWWPRGYGEQALYDVTVTLALAGSAAASPAAASPAAASATGDGTAGAGEPLDRWEGRIGFRTIELDTAADLAGSAFAFSVNGRPVYVRGLNWIPGDAFITRMNRQRYRQAIGDALDAQVNLLRIWGGGIYESEDFYQACDELGILVWQDFLFACAAYAEEDPLRSEVEAEAREAITRLSQHASLALWNGGNENVWGYVEWSWRPALVGRTWGRGYYLDLLPALVAELDPRTPYCPSSPFSFSEFVHPNDPRSGSMHIWDVWNDRDYSAYREYLPRFVAEFGFQGPPAFSTLTSAVHDEPLAPYGPTLLVHQKAADGNLKLERGLGDHLPRWRDFDEWHWATQLNQARAVGFGIEHFRSLSPLNRGVVVWQLNDCWPVVSWAAVDSAGIRKPLWHTLRRVFADRLLTVQPRGDGLALIAHNESESSWAGTVQVVRARTTQGGEVLAEQTLSLKVPPRGVTVLSLAAGVATPAEPEAEFLVARVDGAAPAFWYFVEDPVLRLCARPAVTTVEVVEAGDPDSGPDGETVLVTVSARALVKDLTLLADRVHPAWRVDSGMVTLAAGDSHTFRVHRPAGTAAGLEPDVQELTAGTVLRSANDLVV